MNSLKANLLVAIPDLSDPNFNRTVVLLIDHDQFEGAFGVILNRPTGIPVREVWAEVGESSCASDQCLYQGGPVSGTLLGLHTSSELANITIMEGLYATTQKDELDQLVNQDEHPFRIFSGYAGWGGGQLEGEVDAGGWLITPCSVDTIFSPAEELWKSVADSIAQRIILGGVGANIIPLDPDMN